MKSTITLAVLASVLSPLASATPVVPRANVNPFAGKQLYVNVGILRQATDRCMYSYLSPVYTQEVAGAISTLTAAGKTDLANKAKAVANGKMQPLMQNLSYDS
jgi:cellulose 1,4-beta-cellobiosidase